MKRWLTLLLPLSLTGCAISDASEPSLGLEDTRPKIMVLATHHFTGGGYDHVNPQVDNYLSPHRQDEIISVVNRLAAFKPTKIALEIHPDETEAFNQKYQAYRDGEHELEVSERQQIGMRIAAIMDHPQVYAVDFRNGGMDIGGLFELGAETGQTEIIEHLTQLRETMSAQDAELNRKDVTIAERLMRENGEEVSNAHNVYLTLAQIGDSSNSLGAIEMGNWWTRNLHIFANISHVAEPNDRILVIFGSGHKFLLDQFIEDSREFVLIDSRRFLKDPS